MPGTETDVGQWLDDFEGLANDPDISEIKKTLSKYDEAENPTEAALKGAHEAQKILGDPNRMPESFEKLTDEQKAEVMVKVAKMQGVPESVEGYEITRPQLPEGMTYDEGAEKLIKEIALSHKWTKATTQEIYNAYNNLMIQRNEAINKQRDEDAEKTLNQLETDLGGNANLTEHRELCHRLLMHFGGDTEDEQEALLKCLDMTHLVDTKDGKQRISLGNMVPLLKALGRMAVRLEKEGVITRGTETEKEGSQQSLRQQRFPNSPGMDTTKE